MHLWMHDVNDDHWAAGGHGGTTKMISEFQVGIEATTAVMPIGYSNN